jgi:uncharacterized protein (TIGR02058 family)
MGYMAVRLLQYPRGVGSRPSFASGMSALGRLACRGSSRIQVRPALALLRQAAPPKLPPQQLFHHPLSTHQDAPDLEIHFAPPPAGFETVIMIEAGCGTDQHGQSLTKACVRACKDAISFNSIPSLGKLVPAGSAVVLRIQLAVPFDSAGQPPEIDLGAVRECFPYGRILPIEVEPGGARFGSMCSVPALGDRDASDSWVFAIACVTVGY